MRWIAEQKISVECSSDLRRSIDWVVAIGSVALLDRRQQQRHARLQTAGVWNIRFMACEDNGAMSGKCRDSSLTFCGPAHHNRHQVTTPPPLGSANN